MVEPINELSKLMEEVPWDIEDLIEINELHLTNVFSKYVKGNIDSDELEEWANLIECRDGFYYNESVKEIIYKIANPLLISTLSKEEFYSQLIKLFLDNNLHFEKLIDSNKK